MKLSNITSLYLTALCMFIGTQAITLKGAQFDRETIKICQGIYQEPQIASKIAVKAAPWFSYKWSAEGSVSWDALQKFFASRGQFFMGAGTVIGVLLALKMYNSLVSYQVKCDKELRMLLERITSGTIINLRSLQPELEKQKQSYNLFPGLQSLFTELIGAINSGNQPQASQKALEILDRVAATRIKGLVIAHLMNLIGF